MVKIGYSESTGMVRVSIDERNTGDFKTCFTEVTHFEPGWWKEATIGISATTGQLADNHDILSVETVEGEGDPDRIAVSNPQDRIAASDRKALRELLAENGVDLSQLTATERGVVALMERLQQTQELEVDKLKREVEHTLVGRFVGRERVRDSGGRLAE